MRLFEIKKYNKVLRIKDLPKPNYFYVEALEDGADNLLINKLGNTAVKATNLEYSFDSEEWINVNLGTGKTSITIPMDGNKKIYFRGINPNGFQYDYSNSYQFKMNVKYAVGGELMTLVNYTKSDRSEVPYVNAFSGLFTNCTNLINAYNLVFPTKFTNSCFNHMFESCTNLEVAPNEIVMERLDEWIFDNFCYNCTKLTDTPILTIKDTAQKSNAFRWMFCGCINLNKVTIGRETNPDVQVATSTSYNLWLSGVSATGTIYKPSAVTLLSAPSGWTIENY